MTSIKIPPRMNLIQCGISIKKVIEERNKVKKDLTKEEFLKDFEKICETYEKLHNGDFASIAPINYEEVLFYMITYEYRNPTEFNREKFENYYSIYNYIFIKKHISQEYFIELAVKNTKDLKEFIYCEKFLYSFLKKSGRFFHILNMCRDRIYAEYIFEEYILKNPEKPKHNLLKLQLTYAATHSLNPEVKKYYNEMFETFNKFTKYVAYDV